MTSAVSRMPAMVLHRVRESVGRRLTVGQMVERSAWIVKYLPLGREIDHADSVRVVDRLHGQAAADGVVVVVGQDVDPCGATVLTQAEGVVGGRRQGIVGAPLAAAEQNVVQGGRTAVVLERCRQVGIVGEVLFLVERIDLAPLGTAKMQIVLFARARIGPERLDQVVMGSNVLEAVEPLRQRLLIGAALEKPMLDEVLRSGTAIVAEGGRQIVIIL